MVGRQVAGEQACVGLPERARDQETTSPRQKDREGARLSQGMTHPLKLSGGWNRNCL